MSNGIDAATSQRGLSFGLARSQGYESCYVKLGGDNVGRYIAPYYLAELRSVRAAGMRAGHYWVPNAGRDAVDAANYFVDNIAGWTASDFAVLDNESLDGARRYDDAAVAAWVRQVQSRLGVSGRQVKVYLGLADARSNDWSQTLATGCSFIIAAYSYSAFAFDLLGRIPMDRVDGHQTGGAVIGGVATDVNAWRDNAFDYAAAPAAVAAPAVVVANVAAPSSGAGWAFNLPSQDVQRRIQQALANRGRYHGLIDGVWGPLTIAAIQLTLRNVGYTGELDGIPGPMTCHFVQVYAEKFGSYTGGVDSDLGPFSWAGFALGLERP
ncbi:GH25 family lysozyme [Cryobacterium sp. 5I3]|uniref:GH25 family lysozyme n=1 Tax=Cryobacterium sp. 5I3 TaxID=3048592 RepID=UPI002B23840B|nr:GH25 family lysozyme [Cryobacterium sp. 5I3]MEB0200564.1 GH25 family lysozyme [Cryobacterium sp. 5I3]